MTTLSRQRRKKFEEELQNSALHHFARLWLEHNAYTPEYIDKTLRDCREILAQDLSEASVSRTEKVRGIEAAMFGERAVTESDLPIGDEALKAFERDMQCPGSWSWYPAKSSDEPAWKALREFVVKTYQSDPKAFEGYYTWAKQPYSRGAKTTGQIRQDPTCFEFAYVDYLASKPEGKNTKVNVRLDKDGIPLS